MKYNAESFKKTIQHLVNNNKYKASEGRTCAVASIANIRDGLIDDLFKPEMADDEEVTLSKADIKESFKELLSDIVKEGAKDGFCANTSQAAKAAGFKSEAVALADVDKALGGIL